MKTTMKTTDPHTFIVTTQAKGISHTQVWDSSQPLTLGHPLKWIIEKTQEGVRARDLSGALNTTHAAKIFTVSEADLEKGAALDSGPLQIKIRRAQKPSSILKDATLNKEGELRVFCSIGEWNLSSISLEKNHPTIVLHNGQPAFKITSHGTSFQIDIVNAEAAVAGAKTANPLNASELLNTTITIGPHRWHFGFLPEVQAELETAQKKPLAADVADFRKQLRYVLGGLAVFTFIALVWPKPEPTEELIPPQVAKLILAPSSQPKGQEDAGGSGPAQASKAQNTAVVQAFRAKALQSSISGLLKGGMTRLIAQSDFATGATSANAKRIFETNNQGLLAAGAQVGGSDSKQVLVASLGGGGMGGGAGGGIGYGKGHKAGVAGQGNSLVSLDLGNSLVEEGLTKDEVGEVIHRHLSEVRYCYESAILRTPGIEGRLVIDFTIAGNGIVKSSEIKNSNLPDPRLDDCIIRRLVTWKFPLPKGGIDVAVTYPFIFKTLGR